MEVGRTGEIFCAFGPEKSWFCKFFKGNIRTYIAYFYVSNIIQGNRRRYQTCRTILEVRTDLIATRKIAGRRKFDCLSSGIRCGHSASSPPVVVHISARLTEALSGNPNELHRGLDSRLRMQPLAACRPSRASGVC